MLTSLSIPRPTPRRLLLTGVGMLLALGSLCPRAIAQQITQARIVEILESDQVFIQGRKARRNDSARLGQQIRTQRARAGLRFDVPAGVRMGYNSSVIVGSDCIRLERGRLMVSGSTNRRGCLGSVVAATRGTVYVMELDNQNRGRITVLEGIVDVFDTKDASGTTTTLNAGQTVTVTLDGGVGKVAPATEEQLRDIGETLFQGFNDPLPDLEKVAIIRQPGTGFTSTFLNDAIVGGDSFDRTFDPQKNKPSVNIDGVSVQGTFVRTGQNTAIFVPNATGSPIRTISIDFDRRTISIDGESGVANSLGLSNRNASGTVILQNGQAVRVEVFNVELEEPQIGQPYPGSLTTGRVLDR